MLHSAQQIPCPRRPSLRMTAWSSPEWIKLLFNSHKRLWGMQLACLSSCGSIPVPLSAPAGVWGRSTWARNQSKERWAIWAYFLFQNAEWTCFEESNFQPVIGSVEVFLQDQCLRLQVYDLPKNKSFILDLDIRKKKSKDREWLSSCSP